MAATATRRQTNRITKHLNGHASKPIDIPVWIDDLKAESDFRRMAIAFSKERIQFSRLDLKESQVNGARMNDAILPHKIEDYIQGFRNGDTFPSPVVHKTASGYVILSGNQRCESLRQLIESGELPDNLEIDVYVLDTRDKMLLEIVARSANASHGEGMSKEERIYHAVYCVQRLGMATSDAAKSFLVSPGSINNHIQAEGVRNVLQRGGISAHRAPNSQLVPLAKLDYDESAQLKLGALIVQHSPTAERVRQVVATVAKQTTAQSRNQKIKEYERELAAQAHAAGAKINRDSPELSRVIQRPRRDKILSLLVRAANYLEAGNAGEPFSVLSDLQITTKADSERFLDLSKRVRYRLGVLSK